jgi:prepilin-type processing-associated H-X9-DG protein
MLIALLLPAVQAVRRNAQQTQCINNQKQLSLAMIALETAKGNLPGYSQYQNRGNNKTWIQSYIPSGATNLAVRSTTGDDPVVAKATPISWAAILLPRIEQQAYWDQLVDASMVDPVPIKLIDSFRCPADTDALSRRDLGALSYSANTGGWDYDSSGNFLAPTPSKPKQGDVIANGVFFNRSEPSGPQSRLGSMKDGSHLTIMLTENIHKDYDNTSFPFSWLGGTEQQVGVVWVVPPNPSTPEAQPAPPASLQEAINRVDPSITTFDPTKPRFARPSSNHGEGAVVAFCDGHVEFLRQDIDYVTYQRLLTATGRKCVNPENWDDKLGNNETMWKFQRAAPLTESDFR